MKAFPIILIPEPIEEILAEIDSELQKNKIPLATIKLSKKGGNCTNLRIWIDIVLMISTIGFFTLAIKAKEPILFGIWLFLLTTINFISNNHKFIPQFLLLKRFTPNNSINQTINYQRIEYLRAKICQVFSEAELGNQNKTKAQVGYSERYFQKYLEQYFPGFIFHQIELTIDGSDFPYSADFVYNDSDGIKIDIEVDEPYSYKNPQPIHFLGSGKDERRNKHFLIKGWIVIRFAESQVVRYPRECCKVIAQTISKISGKTYYEAFRGVPNLKKVPIWSKQEAMKMLNHKYRDEYTYIIKSTLNDIEEDEVQYSEF